MKKPSEHLAKLAKGREIDGPECVLVLRCTKCRGANAWLEWVAFDSRCPDCGGREAKHALPHWGYWPEIPSGDRESWAKAYPHLWQPYEGPEPWEARCAKCGHVKRKDLLALDPDYYNKPRQPCGALWPDMKLSVEEEAELRAMACTEGASAETCFLYEMAVLQSIARDEAEAAEGDPNPQPERTRA